MEGEANLPAPPSVLNRPINPEPANLRPSCTSSSATASPEFRRLQAVYKRHRPLSMMQSNNIKPRRAVVHQRETPKGSTSNTGPTFYTKKTQDEPLHSQRLKDCVPQPKNSASVVGETPEVASITAPSEWGSTLNTQEDNFKPYNAHNELHRSISVSTNNNTVASDVLEPEHVLPFGGQKKVHFGAQSNAGFQEMELDLSNHTEAPTVLNQDLQPHNIKNSNPDGSSRPETVISSSLARNLRVSDQLRTFLQDDMSHPVTQLPIIGTSCATTTLVNPGSAPMLNSTTYSKKPQHPGSCNGVSKITGHINMDIQPMAHREVMHASDIASICPVGVPINQAAFAAPLPISNTENRLENKQSVTPDEKQNNVGFDTSQNPSAANDLSLKESGINLPSEAPLSSVQSLDVKLEPNRLGKQEKCVGSKSTSRKKNYEADLFFKVNGKLYQKLGKIGSGGSSEVYKVISSDCTIYALKKIKLKGRDYATAYGFCQEIEYLNKLKGKNNIIQLIDYEVTDKVLLQEVTNGSMNNKDGRVKEDGYIYMVLEYGEIDLAHMLSQKWKELDSSSETIDENWLRFYWQQILLAVNTIHEERIVHSDLKPANFLLVRGSLKLIDFGIAKAIMSDTTNIQRDSQVGTLSYMSPEAFLCNETDANGNTIKCGRPSDIWSLGCILYQMVYGRTPFSEYKTFWAKFKVITDPNHEIIYEPVSNPWLLDLMKKCLAWDRSERWRIPQLLEHPFLVPPVQHQIPAILNQSCKFLQLVTKSCKNDQTAMMLCSQLDHLLKDPISSSETISPEEQQKLLYNMSNLCLQLANLQKLKNASV